MWRRIARLPGVLELALIGLAVGVTALASRLTTVEVWHAGLPSGEVRVQVRSSDGRPVPHATLAVFDASTGRPAVGYPFREPTPATADERGRLVLTQPLKGVQSHGTRWRLFWVLPMGDLHPPRFDCEMAAAGFRPARMDVMALFRTELPADDLPRVKRDLGGWEVELPIREVTVTLQPAAEPIVAPERNEPTR